MVLAGGIRTETAGLEPSKVEVVDRAAEAMVSSHLQTAAGHLLATKAATASSSSKVSTEGQHGALQDTLLHQHQEVLHGASSSSSMGQHKVSTAAAAT
jgi:hypothetical protein